MFVCDACDKEFSTERLYQAHINSHVVCPTPGCGFAALRAIVTEHRESAHTSLKKTNLESAEEIQAWIAARKKNWPSKANVERKEEEGDAKPTAKRRRGDPQQQPSSENALTSILGYGSDEAGQGDDAPEEKPSTAPAAPKRPCRFFQRGRCRNGAKCTYLHERTRGKQRSKKDNNKTPSRGTSLLEKLLRPELEREKLLVLQVIQHLAETGRI
mmetsp:Transcript_67899/g.159776  ORF Transcript_67899/g.159776 Transcript_67899/m.159776 type:complete len:214 (-) Transcript_67899:231-872(-)